MARPARCDVWGNGTVPAGPSSLCGLQLVEKKDGFRVVCSACVVVDVAMARRFKAEWVKPFYLPMRKRQEGV